MLSSALVEMNHFKNYVQAVLGSLNLVLKRIAHIISFVRDIIEFGFQKNCSYHQFC